MDPYLNLATRRTARRGASPRASLTRAAITIVATVVLLAAAAGGALAGHVDSNVKSYTGCLTTQGGTLTLIREGDAPAKTCSSGSVEAHLSGGDITSVTAGTGLMDGGANGAVTLSLDPRYALRQDCGDGQVVKWDAGTSAWICADDLNTPYTAGTGLVLDGTEFSLDANFSLPQACAFGQAATWTHTVGISGAWSCASFAYASQDCASGKFVNGLDEDGKVKCAAGSGGSGGSATVLTAKETNPFNGNNRDDHVGIADDGGLHTFATLDLPAGTYAITATGVVQSIQDVCSGIGACFFDELTTCQLSDGSDSVTWDSDQFNDSSFNGAFNLVESLTTSGTSLLLQCRAQNEQDGLSLHDARIIAIKVG